MCYLLLLFFLALSVFIYISCHFISGFRSTHPTGCWKLYQIHQSIWWVWHHVAAISSSESKGRKRKRTLKLFEKPFSLFRGDSSYWTRQSVSTNSCRYRVWPALLSTSVSEVLSCLPMIWQAHNNRSHTESFESPIGLCLVSKVTPPSLPNSPYNSSLSTFTSVFSSLL